MGCAAHRLGSIISVGLRIGEVLGLRWADIDFEAGTLSVVQAIERGGGDAEARRPLIARRKARGDRAVGPIPAQSEWNEFVFRDGEMRSLIRGGP